MTTERHLALMAATLALTIAFAHASPLPTAELRLTWDPPTNNTDGTPLTDLAGYKVGRGLTPGAYNTIQNVGTNTTATFTNLLGSSPAWPTNYALADDGNSWTITLPAVLFTAGPTYFFAAKAYNTAQHESDFSEELTWQSLAMVTAYQFCIGVNIGQLTNIVAAGLSPTLTRLHALDPRTTLYVRGRALFSDGTYIDHPATLAINNRKPGKPSKPRPQ